MGCRSMIPVASLIAAVLQCIGVAMFCSSAILGFNESLLLFSSNETLAGIAHDNYVYNIEIGVYAWTAFMMLWAVGFLFSAFMTTAQTSARFAHEGGNLCCSSLGCVGAALFFNYIVLILWVAILCASSLLFTFSLMISGYQFINNGDTSPTLVDFSYYGLKIDQVVEVEDLKGISDEMILYFSLTVGGSALVTFGLINSIACMSSNWKHLKVGDQWKGYAHKRKQEERELHEMTSYKSSERLANSLYY
ncbi:proteolipid protein DM beta-like [Lytechinus variegatus]|uniref:proteolipid protein DM beta-like n=1 Tax=Lytechinus variegatus TaxID=7654 RepID=UPI001BB2AD2F|nr:proteolipid protein DM beta-like [Lytechinus variegatus]